MLIFTDITKVFAIRSGSLFRVEYRLTEADAFGNPVSFAELTEDLNNVADNAREGIGGLRSELERLGFKYAEFYKQDGQGDELSVSIRDGQLILSQRGNLHTEATNLLEDELKRLGYQVVWEK